MAADVEETHAPAQVPPLCHLHQHNYPPLPHHHNHHLPFPPFFHHNHHYQLPPRPFLCARCKCWNFFTNPSFNPHPHHQYRSHLQQGHPHLYHPNPHAAESAQFLKDPEVDHQTENSPSNRCGADEMEEVEEENYEFVMTDEWIEFFAKSEARREEKKRQQKKAARDLRKATRAKAQVQEPSQHIDEECTTS